MSVLWGKELSRSPFAWCMCALPTIVLSTPGYHLPVFSPLIYSLSNSLSLPYLPDFFQNLLDGCNKIQNKRYICILIITR